MSAHEKRAHLELCSEWHHTTAHSFVPQFPHSGTGSNVPLTSPLAVNTKTLKQESARHSVFGEGKGVGCPQRERTWPRSPDPR